MVLSLAPEPEHCAIRLPAALHYFISNHTQKHTWERFSSLAPMVSRPPRYTSKSLLHRHTSMEHRLESMRASSCTRSSNPWLLPSSTLTATLLLHWRCSVVGASAAARAKAPVRIPNADVHNSRNRLSVVTCKHALQARILSSLCCYSYLPCRATPIFTLPPKVYDTQVCLPCLSVVPCLAYIFPYLYPLYKT